MDKTYADSGAVLLAALVVNSVDVEHQPVCVFAVNIYDKPAEAG